MCKLDHREELFFGFLEQYSNYRSQTSDIYNVYGIFFDLKEYQEDLTRFCQMNSFNDVLFLPKDRSTGLDSIAIYEERRESSLWVNMLSEQEKSQFQLSK